jgi:hypothetical protein
MSDVMMSDLRESRNITKKAVRFANSLLCYYKSEIRDQKIRDYLSVSSITCPTQPLGI